MIKRRVLKPKDKKRLPVNNVHCFITIAYLINIGWNNKKEILYEANMAWKDRLIV
tara:strand:- start:34 stop:198 length:165 start_codon:yes stop_codon:yes gene_type:complete